MHLVVVVALPAAPVVTVVTLHLVVWVLPIQLKNYKINHAILKQLLMIVTLNSRNARNLLKTHLMSFLKLIIYSLITRLKQIIKKKKTWFLNHHYYLILEIIIRCVDSNKLMALFK